MTGLTVVLDQLVADVPGGVGRYSAELTRALIRSAPAGSSVTGFVSSVPDETADGIRASLPGLAALEVSRLERRALALAWSRGFTIPWSSGLIHSPSPLAPLFRHESSREPRLQVVVTVHDVVPWSHPETLTPRGVSWHRRIIRRAERYADAIVVPTHAVAAELGEIIHAGDRIRVIPGGVAPSLAPPPDADARAATLALPERYVLAVGSMEPRKGLGDLVTALASSVLGDVPLVHVGPPGWGAVSLDALAAEHGLPSERLLRLGRIDDADLAVVLSRASVFVMPSLAEGFGLPLLEAMAAGVPTVHTDVAALAEVSAGSGLEVTRGGPGFTDRLAEAIRSVLDDPALAGSLATLGRDRAGTYRWRDSAESVWQLHADL